MFKITAKFFCFQLKYLSWWLNRPFDDMIRFSVQLDNVQRCEFQIRGQLCIIRWIHGNTFKKYWWQSSLYRMKTSLCLQKHTSPPTKTHPSIFLKEKFYPAAKNLGSVSLAHLSPPSYFDFSNFLGTDTFDKFWADAGFSSEPLTLSGSALKVTTLPCQTFVMSNCNRLFFGFQ